jgi:multicomponent Na+:H+ antiporter subunit G
VAVVTAWVTVALLVAGATLMLLAAVGVVRMPDVFSRMQAATKASSLGIGCMMLAVAVYFGDLAITTRVLMIVVFIFLTAPVSAHMIGRAAYRVGVPPWKGTVIDDLRDRNTGPTSSRESGRPEGPA